MGTPELAVVESAGVGVGRSHRPHAVPVVRRKHTSRARARGIGAATAHRRRRRPLSRRRTLPCRAQSRWKHRAVCVARRRCRTAHSRRRVPVNTLPASPAPTTRPHHGFEHRRGPCGLDDRCVATLCQSLLGWSEDAAVVTALVTAATVVTTMVRFSRRTAETILKRFCLPQSVATNLLLIRAAGDEATSALAAVHFASWLARGGCGITRRASFTTPPQPYKRRGPWRGGSRSGCCCRRSLL
jgi:hypothetical protein